jgi:hypothetical protein
MIKVYIDNIEYRVLCIGDDRNTLLKLIVNNNDYCRLTVYRGLRKMVVFVVAATPENNARFIDHMKSNIINELFSFMVQVTIVEKACTVNKLWCSVAHPKGAQAAEFLSAGEIDIKTHGDHLVTVSSAESGADHITDWFFNLSIHKTVPPTDESYECYEQIDSVVHSHRVGFKSLASQDRRRIKAVFERNTGKGADAAVRVTLTKLAENKVLYFVSMHEANHLEHAASSIVYEQELVDLLGAYGTAEMLYKILPDQQMMEQKRARAKAREDQKRAKADKEGAKADKEDAKADKKLGGKPQNNVQASVRGKTNTATGDLLNAPVGEPHKASVEISVPRSSDNDSASDSDGSLEGYCDVCAAEHFD